MLKVLGIVPDGKSLVSPDEMRGILSVQYQGTWKDRLDKMPDKQVYVIYQRYLDKSRRKN